MPMASRRREFLLREDQNHAITFITTHYTRNVASVTPARCKLPTAAVLKRRVTAYVGLFRMQRDAINKHVAPRDNLAVIKYKSTVTLEHACETLSKVNHSEIS